MNGVMTASECIVSQSKTCSGCALQPLTITAFSYMSGRAKRDSNVNVWFTTRATCLHAGQNNCVQNVHKYSEIKQGRQHEEEQQQQQNQQLLQKNATLLQLADERNISVALLARLILDHHLSHTEYAGGHVVPKSLITALMKDPRLLGDKYLSYEIFISTLYDDNYGPLVDTIKHSIGHEYECKLRSLLNAQNLVFLEEEQMRDRGYDKTPDFKLDVPIAVNGHVVNWIESKASFGDPEAHAMYLKEQFWSYWNRFGAGLVIYWFGFVDEIDVHATKGIQILDRFPSENIVYMNPSIST